MARPGLEPAGFSRPYLTGLAVGLIFGVAIYFRLSELGSRNFWTDEAWVALAAMQPTAKEALAAGQSTPPFYLLTVWALVQLWGHGEMVLRSLSWLFGAGTLWLTWRLSRRLVEVPAALLALAAVAFSPIMVYYSKELKQYSGDAFFAVLILWLTERLQARGGRQGWLALALAGVVGLGFSQPLIFTLPVVVAVNRFLTDSPAELELIRKAAIEEGGAEDAVICDHWEKGGAGAVDLAHAVVKAAEKPANFKFLYPLEWTIKQKIEIIAKEVYGADGVDYLPEAEERIADYTRLGFDKLPICMAKTHLSLSHDAALKGVPTGFRIPIRDVRASVGAGFLYPLLGTMSTMPGLPTRPIYMEIDIETDTGKIIGLS